MKLHGRNAIVTGGSSGLGRAIVEAFLREGASVAFCARTASDVERTLGELRRNLRSDQRLVGVTADVSRESDVEKLFTAATALGDLHVLVNNAGIYGPIGPIESVNLDDWRRTFDINVHGMLLTARRAIPGMKERRHGKLIQISGGGAAPIANCSAYTVTKMAVTRLTEAFAEELRAFGIDSNAIAPGPRATKLMKEVLDAGPKKAGTDFYEKNVKWSQGAAVSPELGANVAVYLASTESNGVTGKLIAAQWDPWETLHQHRTELAGDIYTFRRIVPKDRGKTWGER